MSKGTVRAAAAAGPRVGMLACHRSLGLIDMRDIATTLARRLDLPLPTAEGKVLLP